MKNCKAQGEIKESAHLYLLGLLSGEETTAFEQHLAGGCETCESEMLGMDEVVAGLSLIAQEESPPLEIRELLLRRVAEEAEQSVIPTGQASTINPNQFITVRAGEGEWQVMAKGVFSKTLYRDEQRGTLTSLIKMEAGARISAHKHQGIEECSVLEGDFHVNGEVLGAGDYHCARAGSVHQDLSTKGGALLLVIVGSDDIKNSIDSSY